MTRSRAIRLLAPVIFSCVAITAHADRDSAFMPLYLGGNLGYLYNYTRADAGADGETTQVTGQLNMNSYIWQPWLARFGASGTVSASRSQVASGLSDTNLGSYNFNLNLFPVSRFPFSLTLLGTDDIGLGDGQDSLSNPFGVGKGYHVRFVGARQSIIGLGGDRFDTWYHDRYSVLRDRAGDYSPTTTAMQFTDRGQTERTVGASYKGRIRNNNFDLTGARQEYENSAFDSTNISDSVAMTHHYIPSSSNYYVKTLASMNNVENRLTRSNCPTNSLSCGYAGGPYFSQAKTNESQVSSFFYWRPEYRPYALTASLRLHRREVDSEGNKLITQQDRQVDGFGNLAGNYEITRRLRFTGALGFSGLDTERGNTVSSTQNASLQYQSDPIFFREFNYSYYGDVTAGNRTAAEYDTIQFSETMGLGAGHRVSRRWATGNRATLRVNVQQSVRESLGMYDVEDKTLSDLRLGSKDFAYDGTNTTINHVASMTWTDDIRAGGSSLAQLSMIDTRGLEDELESQLVNLQLSHTIPMTRQSSFSANGSLQSSRRVTSESVEKPFIDEFLTTASGRLSYQHERLFGIYKLNFRTKLDAYTSVNRSGGDRMQADWENRLGYAIGKLNASMMYRHIFSDSGLGVYTMLLHLNRSF